MDKLNILAYQNLLYAGLVGIQSHSSAPISFSIRPSMWKYWNKSNEVIHQTSVWLQKIALAHEDSFKDFDEVAFWQKHKDLCTVYPDYDFMVYKDLYEDSLKHFNNA